MIGGQDRENPFASHWTADTLRRNNTA